MSTRDRRILSCLTLTIRRVRRAALVLAIVAPAAQAVPILDQVFDVYDQGGGGQAFDVHSNQSMAQTLVVGVSGRLSRVDVQARRTWVGFPFPIGDLLLDVMTTFGGVPDAVLGTVSLPSADVPRLGTSGPGWVSFDVTALDLVVGAGDAIALALRGPNVYSGHHHGWAFVRGGAYACGATFGREENRSRPEWRLQATELDMGFRTWVDGTVGRDPQCGVVATPPSPPVGVPEPPLAALVLTALGLLAAGRRPVGSA